jgi:hypothetical protein
MFVSWDWETNNIILSSFEGTDTTGNKVSTCPTMDSTAPLEKLNMIDIQKNVLINVCELGLEDE